MSWYFHVLKNYVTFSGRATRSEYWYFTLFSTIAIFILAIIDELLGTKGVLNGLYLLAVILPSLAVAVRRLHDINKSGWWLLLYLIPLLGAIVLLVFFCTDSKEDNKYGMNPKSNNSNNLGSNAIFQLEKLAELKDKGIITEEEFESKKKQILG